MHSMPASTRSNPLLRILNTRPIECSLQAPEACKTTPYSSPGATPPVDTTVLHSRATLILHQAPIGTLWLQQKRRYTPPTKQHFIVKTLSTPKQENSLNPKLINNPYTPIEPPVAREPLPPVLVRSTLLEAFLLYARNP